MFQAGPLCRSASDDEQGGVGYIHVVRRGTLNVETRGQPSFRVEEPSLFFYMNPNSHRLFPMGDGVDMVCASFDFGAGLRNPLFQALPDVLMLTLEETPALAASLTLLFAEVDEYHFGRQAVLDRLIEVVVIQLLRALMDQNRLQVGLLGGLAEPRLAKAINAMHADPARAWAFDTQGIRSEID